MSPLDAGTASPLPDIAARTFAFTFGKSATQRIWTDHRRATWPELTAWLTKHEVGPKEGPCFVPALFLGTARKKDAADRIDLAVLDSDCGHTLEEIKAAVEARGWAAIVHSTHSHLTTRTTVKSSHWEKFVREFPADAEWLFPDAERLFLIGKGYLPRVAEGARLGKMTADEVTLEHAPCPKFRIVLRLSRPWRAAGYPDQSAANAAWKERIEALAAALGLSHDQSCTDTSRLFYLPRYPGDGREPVAAVIEGADCDIWGLPPAAKPAHAGGLGGAKPSTADDAGEFTDPETGECIDLRKWARERGWQFEIVTALRARTPEIFIGYVAEGTRHHIRCANEDAHTSDDPDRATFTVNASEANNKGFVVHCRHAHCTGLDRLFFVKRMLERGWLKIEDLTLPAFLAPAATTIVEPLDKAESGATPANAPLVLSPAAPLKSARQLVRCTFMRQQCRILHHQQDTFYRWRGTHYAEDVRERIRAVVYDFLDGATRIVDDKPAPFNPDKAKVANVLEALAAVTQLPDTAIAPSWLDDAPHLPASEFLPCANGLLHLPTRVLTPATPAFFGLNAVDYPYDASAPKPTAWLRFLTSIWPNDQASIDTLQELFGLLLTADTSQQKAFLIVGPKRSGKGTIARILTAMLGRDNVAGPTLSSLTQNFGLAPLIGKPLAVISDARLGGRADASVVVERLLAITGEDAITVDRKFREAWTGRLPTRFLILTNELPRVVDASGALASRFIIFVLTKSFYGKEDAALTEKLIAELPGILQWAIYGRDRLAGRGHFVQPASAQRAADELADLGSPIGAFLRDRCVVGPDKAVAIDALYAAWVAWCRANARDHPGTVQGFGRDLWAALPGLDTTQLRDAKTGERVRYYQGVGLPP